MSEPTKDLGAVLSELSAAMEEHAKRYVWQSDIKWPIEVSGVSIGGRLHNEKDKVGDLVMVRMCDVTKATHLGIYLGEFPMEFYHQFDTKTGNIVVHPHLNPVMFVPKLKRIVWGCESYWGEIKNEEQLRQISDEEISEIWYVKLLKQMAEQQKEQE